MQKCRLIVCSDANRYKRCQQIGDRRWNGEAYLQQSEPGNSLEKLLDRIDAYVKAYVPSSYLNEIRESR